MSLFQVFEGEITHVEAFKEEQFTQPPGRDRPGGYATIVKRPENEEQADTAQNSDGVQELDDTEEKKVTQPPELIIITIEMKRFGKVRCVVDSLQMNMEKNAAVKVIFAGRKVAAILNMDTDEYVFYKAPLFQKYTIPRIILGGKVVFISMLGGFVLTLLATKIQSPMLNILFEGLFFLLFISGIIYAVYHASSSAEAEQNIDRFVRKLK